MEAEARFLEERDAASREAFATTQERLTKQSVRIARHRMHLNTQYCSCILSIINNF
jgi:hypothetical protein